MVYFPVPGNVTRGSRSLIHCTVAQCTSQSVAKNMSLEFFDLGALPGPNKCTSRIYFVYFPDLLCVLPGLIWCTSRSLYKEARKQDFHEATRSQEVSAMKSVKMWKYRRTNPIELPLVIDAVKISTF
jgi:hypothetical protein